MNGVIVTPEHVIVDNDAIEHEVHRHENPVAGTRALALNSRILCTSLVRGCGLQISYYVSSVCARRRADRAARGERGRTGGE